MQIARRIRGICAEYKLNGTDVAKAVGLTQPAWSRRVNGQVDFSIDELAKLAQALGMSLGDLVVIDRAREGEPTAPYVAGLRSGYPLRLVRKPRSGEPTPWSVPATVGGRPALRLVMGMAS